MSTQSNGEVDSNKAPNTQLSPTCSVTDWSQLLASPDISLSHAGWGWVKFVLQYSQAIGLTCKRCLTFVLMSLWCKSCMCLFSWGVLLFVGSWVVYSPLFSLGFTWFCSLKMVEGREQTSMFCWGTRAFGLPITFMADLLCFCNAFLQEKLLPRLCVPVGMSPCWCQPGLAELFSSNSTFFFYFYRRNCGRFRRSWSATSGLWWAPMFTSLPRGLRAFPLIMMMSR